MPESSSPETVAFGAAPAGTRRRWGTRAVVLGSALMMVAGWWVDDRRTEVEREAVRSCAAAAESATTMTHRRLSARASYIAPALAGSASSAPEALHALLSQDAAIRLPAVEDALARCRRVRLWWFHVAERRGRDAQIALLAAERDWLRGITRDGTAFYDGYDVLARLHDQAVRSVPRD